MQLPTRTLLFGGVLALAAPATGQVQFSIEWHGPTIAVPDSGGGIPITEGDILAPVGGMPALGPLPPPPIVIPAAGGGLGLLPGCTGHPPGTPCWVEVDALSHGTDFPFTGGGILPGSLWFSVDEFAMSMGPMAIPDVGSEFPPGDSSADVFANLLFMPPTPLPPVGPFPHIGAIDGDGLPSGSGFAYPGVGIIEPNPPVGGPAHPGDDLDALDLWSYGLGAPVYFSLDAPYVDPLTGVAHSGSAAAHGVTAADVLLSPTPGVFAGPWAPAGMLGLNMAGIDDIDALILLENGTGVFEPSLTPFDWMGGNTDMLLFSVRRGSAVIGLPDSIFGIPIEEGDILTTPLVGGASPFPGIMVAAENLGLATARSMGVQFGDDLNALDCSQQPLFDCNGNGVEDAVDIGTGTSLDGNMNGIPDECEGSIVPFCFCGTVSVCGNTDPSAGCANSTGSGALMSGSGGTSVSLDNLVLTITSQPANAYNLIFMGPTTMPPVFLADGLRCVTGQLFRFPAVLSDGTGTTVFPGVTSYANSTFPPAGQIAAGSTWHFQDWYRDPSGPCGTNSNISSAVSVTFTP